MEWCGGGATNTNVGKALLSQWRCARSLGAPAGMVQGVVPRRNELSDPAIANVDAALMVFSVAQPPFEPANATRFLVSAEAAGVPVRVLLNKADLLPPDQLAATMALVRAAPTAIAAAGRTAPFTSAVHCNCRARVDWKGTVLVSTVQLQRHHALHCSLNSQHHPTPCLTG